MQVVSAIIPLEGHRYALVEEAKAVCRAQWSVPGGVIEDGECLSAAIVREVYEEAGLTVLPVGILRVDHYLDPGARYSHGVYEQKLHFVCVAALTGPLVLKTVPDAESLSSGVFRLGRDATPAAPPARDPRLDRGLRDRRADDSDA